jgi:hypothetical protein
MVTPRCCATATTATVPRRSVAADMAASAALPPHRGARLADLWGACRPFSLLIGTMPISRNEALFGLLGTRYGGNGTTTFALPNLKKAAPNGLSYSICATSGIFP